MTRRLDLTLRVAFACLLGATIHCGGGENKKPVGSEGGPCTSAGACDPGLSCLSNVCVDASNLTSTNSTTDAGGKSIEPGPDANVSAADVAPDAPLALDTRGDAGESGAPDSVVSGGAAGADATAATQDSEGAGGVAGSLGAGGQADAAMASGGSGGSTGPGGPADSAVPTGGSAGGPDGSVTSPPVVDASCGFMSVSAVREPVDMLLLLDRSASMAYATGEDCFCSDEDAAAIGGASYALCADSGNCQNRWSAVESAVSATLSSTQSIQWGLQLFPSVTGAQCSVSSTEEVPVGANTAAAINLQVQSALLGMGTPTAAALEVATAYLKAITDGRSKAILLATDGEPNCADGSLPTSDVAGATAAAMAAREAGFPVYVVGLGPNLANLDHLAIAGGTSMYHSALSATEIAAAFATITDGLASCTFTLANQPQDSNNVYVYLDKLRVDKDPVDGWAFGSSTQAIVLAGLACERVTSGQAGTVQVLFGCPGGPPAPLFLP